MTIKDAICVQMPTEEEMDEIFDACLDSPEGELGLVLARCFAKKWGLVLVENKE